MLDRVLIAVFCLGAAAAHAQCSGLSAYSGPRGTFAEGAPVNAADLNCMQSTLQSTFLPRSGGTITGVLNTLPTGTPRPTGDNTATLDFQGNRLNILKQLMTAQTNTPNLFVQLNNSSPMPLASYGLYPQIGALAVASYGLTGGTASLDSAIFTLNLYGNKPFQAQDVDIQAAVNQYGHDSSWLMDGWTRDLSGEPPGPFSQVGIEMDLSGNGPDAGTASYDPLHTYRLGGLSINPGAVVWPGWEPVSTYRAPGANQPGSIIQQTNAAGVLSIYKATTGGTSGRTRPVFPNSGTVADGTVIWSYQQPAAYEVGRGIWLDGLEPNTSFGSGFASNARFEDAAIDISEARLGGAASAGIRLAAQMPIDFSGNGTASAQNLRVLQYTEKANALTYTVKGAVALSIADTGLASFPGQVQAPLATPKSSSSPCVAGTRTADANYEYVCVATNKWKRAALSNF